VKSQYNPHTRCAAIGMEKQRENSGNFEKIKTESRVGVPHSPVPSEWQQATGSGMGTKESSFENEGPTCSRGAGA